MAIFFFDAARDAATSESGGCPGAEIVAVREMSAEVVVVVGNIVVVVGEEMFSD